MLKNDFFWIFQGKVATSEGEVNKSVFIKVDVYQRHSVEMGIS